MTLVTTNERHRRRRTKRWNTAVVVAAMMMMTVVAMFGTSVVCVAGENTGGSGATCDAGCAPVREIKELEKTKTALEHERDALKKDSNKAKEQAMQAKKKFEEVSKAREANAARVKELEASAAEAATEAKKYQASMEKLEKQIATTMKELETVRQSESARVAMLEAQLHEAQEAWVPVWLQRRAEPVTKATMDAVEKTKQTTARTVEATRQQTARVVEMGKTQIPKVVNAGKEQTMKVVNAGKEQTMKVVNAGKEHIPKVVNVGKEQTAKVVQAGKNAVGKVSEQLTVLKELKADMKEARLIHEKRMKKGAKSAKSIPEKFTTRQAVRALQMMDQFETSLTGFVAKMLKGGIFKRIYNAVKNEIVRIFSALAKSYRERFIPMTRDVRAATTKHVGVRLATLFLTTLARIPSEHAQKIPIDFSKYTVDQLAPKIADGLLTVILGGVALIILLDITRPFFRDYTSRATYSFMKVPDEDGVDVLIRLPNVESMNEVDFKFDQTWNQIHIDADEAGHSELIVVPKCKTGVKRWGKPSPIFLEGEETILVELRPVGASARAQRAAAEPVRETVSATPFAPVAKKQVTKRNVTTNGADKPTNGRSTRTRR
jgi:hypothetical protein